MKRHPTRGPRRGGFTLVEMLVVLGILVLLASMVVPRILSRQKSANVDAAKVQIRLFQEALKTYAIDCKGEFPATEQGLYALFERPPDLFDTFTWKGPYLEGAMPPRDPWGNDYLYEYPPTHGYGEDPEIWSFGPDGEDGTEDDICSWSRDEEMLTEEGLVLDSGTTGPAKRAPREPGLLPPGKGRPSAAPPPIRKTEPVIID